MYNTSDWKLLENWHGKFSCVCVNHDWIEGGLDVLSITRHLPLHNRSWHILLLRFCQKLWKENKETFQRISIRKSDSATAHQNEQHKRVYNGSAESDWMLYLLLKTGECGKSYKIMRIFLETVREVSGKFVCEKCEKSPIQLERQGNFSSRWQVKETSRAET